MLFGGNSHKLDLLFVIDNSDSMEHEQRSLKQSFPSDLERLRTAKLGHELPDLRVGVISTDLGAGPYMVGNCTRVGGDQGKLQDKPRIAGCTPPADPWIAYSPGKTNVPGSGQALSRAKAAFLCISELGTGGCGFEQPLEAARRALDPALKVNPGFLRPDAMLAVIFLTDEDDCSARDTRLYDPSSQGLTDPLGPLTSFRCFEFGVKCDCPGKMQCTRQDQGPRKNCVPVSGNGLLHGTDRYVKFLRELKQSAARHHGHDGAHQPVSPLQGGPGPGEGACPVGGGAPHRPRLPAVYRHPGPEAGHLHHAGLFGLGVEKVALKLSGLPYASGPESGKSDPYHMSTT